MWDPIYLSFFLHYFFHYMWWQCLAILYLLMFIIITPYYLRAKTSIALTIVTPDHLVFSQELFSHYLSGELALSYGLFLFPSFFGESATLFPWDIWDLPVTGVAPPSHNSQTGRCGPVGISLPLPLLFNACWGYVTIFTVGTYIQ